ncbi:MAG: DUF2911 domain-containing protein [Bacteroidota bacterium]|nr:DUF2911 domain-containing protein [Bacteroidota bacterium]MDQ6889603.1 DUF2911 domain-containing protein [Bacteroidota bacterium]
MKKVFSVILLAAGLIASTSSKAQMDDDKSKRPSPPAKVSQKISSGATITIDYSQPSVKARTIGKDLEPMDGQVWRTGANEATVFETDKDVMVQGQKLPAGKYGLFTLFNGDDVTVIFNKIWKQWGAFKYSEADDALRVKGKMAHASSPSEKMTFKISPSGNVDLLWGDRKVEFTVK